MVHKAWDWQPVDHRLFHLLSTKIKEEKTTINSLYPTLRETYMYL